MQVMVRGEVFPDVETCAKRFKVSKSTVYVHLSKGTADSIGIGAGRAPGSRNGAGSKPVNLYGVPFRSMEHASLELGYHKAYVQSVLSRGSEGSKARLLRAVMEYKARKEREHWTERDDEWDGTKDALISERSRRGWERRRTAAN